MSETKRTAQMESVDQLTEMWRHDADGWAERVQTTDGRAAAIATAAAALGTLIVSQAAALSKHEIPAKVSLGLLLAAVAVSLVARVVPRVKLRKSGSPRKSGSHGWERVRRWARTPSQKDADCALERLRGHRQGIKPGPDEDELVFKLLLLAYWEARATSNHHSYNAKARWVSIAAILFVIALVFLAVAGFRILGAAGS